MENKNKENCCASCIRHITHALLKLFDLSVIGVIIIVAFLVGFKLIKKFEYKNLEPAQEVKEAAPSGVTPPEVQPPS